MSKVHYYAGIGSRETPSEVLDLFTYLAEYLGKRGLVLRSGGAPGADSAFEVGADRVNAPKDIYLPWRNFNNNPSPLCNVETQAMLLAEHYHPAWGRLSAAARKFHARNVYQVLGKNLSQPCDFILCYTPGGSQSGGTGQAIRVAKAYNVPIIDFGLPNAKEELNQLLRCSRHQTNMVK